MGAAFYKQTGLLAGLSPLSLYRAFVCVPCSLIPLPGPYYERTVFFEVEANAPPGPALEKLLSFVWGVNTNGWCARKLIFNIQGASDLRRSPDDAAGSDLELFEDCRKGHDSDAVGEKKVHYLRAANVDLFVTPRVSARLAELLLRVEFLIEVEPSRRRGKAIHA